MIGIEWTGRGWCVVMFGGRDSLARDVFCLDGSVEQSRSPASRSSRECRGCSAFVYSAQGTQGSAIGSKREAEGRRSRLNEQLTRKTRWAIQFVERNERNESDYISMGTGIEHDGEGSMRRWPMYDRGLVDVV